MEFSFGAEANLNSIDQRFWPVARASVAKENSHFVARRERDEKCLICGHVHPLFCQRVFSLTRLLPSCVGGDFAKGKPFSRPSLMSTSDAHSISRRRPDGKLSSPVTCQAKRKWKTAERLALRIENGFFSSFDRVLRFRCLFMCRADKRRRKMGKSKVAVCLNDFCLLHRFS